MKINIRRYVIINKTTLNFLSTDGYEEDNIENTDKFYTIEGASEEIDRCDTPTDYEIRKLNITYELGKIVENTGGRD